MTVFFFVEFFGFIFYPQPVYAQLPVSVTANLPAQVSQIKDTIISSLTSVALGGLVKAVSSFMNKMARDTAMYIASGGKGQGSMIFQDGAADYFKKTALSASSGVIDDYAGTLSKIAGIDPNKLSGIMVGLRNVNSDPMKALLGGDVSSLVSSLSPGGFDMSGLEKVLGKGGSASVAGSFLKKVNSGGSLGAISKIQNTVTQQVTVKKEGADAERKGDTGVKPVSSIISGVIKTPASTIQEENKALTSKSQSDLNAQQVAGIYGNATLKSIPTALMTFLSTLTSELMKKIMSGDWFDEAKKITASPEASSNSFYSQFIITNKNKALSSFNFLFTVPTRDANEYPNIITDLAECGDIRTVNNCVIDENFMNVLNLAVNGEALTIREALDSEYGKLIDKPFISPERKSQTESKDCAKEGYCYYNMQKLRKLRIVPLGFEIASLLADPDNPDEWKLSKVVAGFYDCGNQGGKLVRDVQHPFCHLIDPNWILKAPSLRCEASVSGSTLSLQDGKSAVRNTECIDFSTKVSENAPLYYSYCTQEKNIWSIDANKCDSQYSTCKKYTGENGSASYLSRTLDFGDCDADNVGCRAFSTEYNINTQTWQNSNRLDTEKKILGRPGTIYFNDKVVNYPCSSSDEGCNKFYLADFSDIEGYTYTPNDIYLKKAPDYYGCYDTNILTDEIDYPQTKVELNQMTGKPEECNNFSQVCIEEEVGCREYSPVDDYYESPDIPGIIGDNVCDSSCVGYETYRQMATDFAPTEFPLYFIPSEGVECSGDYVGCDEFTNIDELNKGGESLQYYNRLRRCELPADDNQKTYYSWEGSSDAGYILKVHNLLPVDDDTSNYISGLDFGTSDAEITKAFEKGSPAYFDDYKEALEKNYGLCNASVYKQIVDREGVEDESQGCRALYDKDGNIYYRILDLAVTVSASCQPLRKTDSLVEIDQYITDSGRCEIKGGVWENGECNRCYAGGKYEQGLCYYWTIPAESNRCPATANGCRAYKGNQSSNIERILFSDFEDGLDGWAGSSVTISAESLQAGQHSLGIRGDVSQSFVQDSLVDGQWYQLSFWARGSAQELTIDLRADGQRMANNVGDFTFDRISNSSKKLSVGAEWKYYKLGPIQLDGVENNMSLVFDSNSETANYYIDNVALTKLSDQTYLIKNSWKKNYEDDGIRDVPHACDDNPDDAYPGRALGCRAYTDETTPNLTDKTFYTTGFEKLCREGAVGCTAVYDTYNSDSKDIEVYNAECRVVASDDLPDPKKCSVSMGDDLFECDLANGKRNCLIERISLPADFEFEGCYESGEGLLEFLFSLLGIDIEIKSDDMCIVPSRVTVSTGSFSSSYLAISDSTIIIPADTREDSPLFLTYTGNSVCGSDQMGCQKVALEEKLIENGNNDVFNFPMVSYFLNNPDDNYFGENNILCSAETYGCNKFTSEEGGTEYFKDPTVLGNVLCNYYQATTPETESGWFMDKVGRCGGEDGNLCVNDEQCDVGVTCDDKIKVPCYENYQDLNGTYGLWSNNSASYRGFIGQCPESQKNCVELKDPQNKSQFYPDGKSYYYIFDDKMKSLESECKGQVNLVDGCVLFDRTDRPTKLYNSEATYAKSDEYNPIQKTKYNTVLPITTGDKDTNLILKVKRDRECSEWLYCRTVVDEIDENGKSYQICPDYGVCNQMDANGVCKSEVLDFSPDVLSIEEYISRDVDWESPEYVGYSLLDKKHIGTFALDQSDDKKEFVLTGTDDKNSKLNSICKAFPEETSPFDPRVVSKDPNILGDKNASTTEPFIRYSAYPFSLYAQANICQTGDCGCEYIKVQYQGGTVTDYWPIDNESTIPPGICTGTGTGAGKPCKENSDCDSSSQVCSFVETKNSYYGTKGFCLEYDKSRPLSINSEKLEAYPCLTWLPFDVRVNNTDSYNTRLEAGYYPGLDTTEGNKGEVYCTESTQGYLYSKKNFVERHINFDFNITSPYIVNNDYDVEGTGWEGFNSDAQWFYTNLQNMMWDKIGSTATVLFSRIPYYIFKGYTASSDSNPNSTHSSVWDGWWNIYNESNLGDPEGTQALSGFINESWDSKDYSNNTRFTNYNFYLGDQYPILLDDIRSLYLSPILFKKKENKALISRYNGLDGTVRHDGFTLFEKLKIDLEGLKTVYENKDKFTEIVTGDFSKYPDFSSSDFIYVYNAYGNANDAELYPLDKDYKGGGGTMYTYSFYGVNKKDNSIRVGVVIDISDPKDYYDDKDKPWDTQCLIDENMEKDGFNRNSVFDIVKGAVLTENPKSAEEQYWEKIEHNKWSASNFVVDFNTGVEEKDKYREYAIVMFKFNKLSDGRYYLNGGYEPLKGGIFRDQGSGNAYLEKFLSGLTMSVTADFKAKCTEFTAVHQDINSVSDNQLNKAWTDRLWIEAQKKNQTFEFNDSFNLYNLDKNGGNAYGVLPDMSQDDLSVIDKILKYYFVDPQYQNYPLTCNDPLSANGKLGTVLDIFQSTGTYCDSLLYGENEGPYKDLVENYKTNKYIDSQGQISGERVISSLFAKAFKIIRRGGNNIYRYDNIIPVWDKAETLSISNNLLVPQIYSLNVDRCADVNNCVADRPNDFTINNVGWDEDPEPDQKEPIVAIGSYSARAKFFVFADENKMPIKSIKIDWGDDKSVYNDEVDGFYANRKPYCEVEDHCFVGDVDKQLTCKTDLDCAGILGATCKNNEKGRMSFGDSARACINKFYSVTYNYICNVDSTQAKSWSSISSSLTPEEISVLGAKGYNSSTSAKYCVFVPKVQVKDNWGWCNGSCSTNGCYESECSNNPNAWTTYPGKIIIVAK